MKLYTKTGDKGETSLGGGQRVSKDSLRIEAYGTVDELNSTIGMSYLESKEKIVLESLEKIQSQLFDLGSNLCMLEEDCIKYNIKKIENKSIDWMEEVIDICQSKLPPLKEFILPRGTKGASFLHISRTICRRAERLCISLKKKEKIDFNQIKYLNRLSDLLFVFSRYENFSSGIKDTPWEKNA